MGILDELPVELDDKLELELRFVVSELALLK
jgi:hypothetical protein